MKTALRPRVALGSVSPVVPPAPVLEKVLSGHSGARVVLHASSNASFVRKSAFSTDGNARLRMQADKQHTLWMLGLPFPQVRKQFVGADGLQNFDMNYIPGRTIADAVMNGGAFDPDAVVKAVERLMMLFTLGQKGTIPARILEMKIREVSSRCGAVIIDPELLGIVRSQVNLLLEKDWTGIPESPCHGDLTLENILFTVGKSVAFIDCDVPFASSYWFDFGKLYQDIAGHWCIRSLYEEGASSVYRLNAIQKLEGLNQRFKSLTSGLDKRLVQRLPQLTGLSLLRVIPYARTDAVRRFICQRIAHVMEADHATPH